MYKGSHPIHRSILEHWIWDIKPFTKGQAWIDMILRANYKDSKIVIDTEIVNIYPGQLVTSILGLSKILGWSRCKTRNFLKLLKNRHMIRQEFRHNALIISLLNYNKLHEKIKKKDTSLDTKLDNRKTAERQQKDTSNNNNNTNNINNKDLTIRELTPLQQVIEHYYDIREPGSSRIWRNKQFAEHLKSGKNLLELTEGNIEQAKSAIDKASKFFKDKGLDWKLVTVIKRYPDIIKVKGGKYDEIMERGRTETFGKRDS